MRAVLLALLSLPVILSSICDKGKFLDGNQVCRDCGTGYMCPDGNTRVPCPPGTFQDVGAQSSCQECFPTTYQVNISNPILDFVSNTNNYGPEKQKKNRICLARRPAKHVIQSGVLEGHPCKAGQPTVPHVWKVLFSSLPLCKDNNIKHNLNPKQMSTTWTRRPTHARKWGVSAM
jgi:hypothetical protein